MCIMLAFQNKLYPQRDLLASTMPVGRVRDIVFFSRMNVFLQMLCKNKSLFKPVLNKKKCRELFFLKKIISLHIYIPQCRYGYMIHVVHI